MEVMDTVQTMTDEASNLPVYSVLTPQPIRLSSSMPSPTFIIISPFNKQTPSMVLEKPKASKALWTSDSEPDSESSHLPHLSHFESGTCLCLGKPFAGLDKDESEECREKKGKRQCCKCQKSRCLKLYCDCFAVGQYCQDCNCVDCLNTMDSELPRQDAIALVLEKNKSAFQEKIQASKHSRGCNCKKSACLKKYCECYQSQVACTDKCKCRGCRNQHKSKRTGYSQSENQPHSANR